MTLQKLGTWLNDPQKLLHTAVSTKTGVPAFPTTFLDLAQAGNVVLKPEILQDLVLLGSERRQVWMLIGGRCILINPLYLMVTSHFWLVY